MFRLAHPRPLRAVCSQPVQLRNVSRALSRFTGYSWYVDNSDVSIVCTQLKRINCNSLPEVTCDDNYRVTNAFSAISWDKLEEFLHMQKKCACEHASKTSSTGYPTTKKNRKISQQKKLLHLLDHQKWRDDLHRDRFSGLLVSYTVRKGTA